MTTHPVVVKKMDPAMREQMLARKPTPQQLLNRQRADSRPMLVDGDDGPIYVGPRR